VNYGRPFRSPVLLYGRPALTGALQPLVVVYCFRVLLPSVIHTRQPFCPHRTTRGENIVRSLSKVYGQLACALDVLQECARLTSAWPRLTCGRPTGFRAAGRVADPALADEMQYGRV